MTQPTPPPPISPYPPPAVPLPPGQAPFSPALVPVPPEVLTAGFNWGAFWWTWIWGIAHNVWIALLAFVVPWPVMNIILALKGNEWAWQNRRFASVQQFRDTQRAWALWGWVLAGVGVLLTLLIILLWVFVIAAAVVTSAQSPSK